MGRCNSLSSLRFTFSPLRFISLRLSFASFFAASHFHTFFVNFPSAAGVLLARLSISRRTPTCSDVDCYAGRIAPYALTCSCKSCMENVEVFSGGGGGITAAFLACEFAALGRAPGERRGSAVAQRDPQEEEAAQAERIMRQNSHN